MENSTEESPQSVFLNAIETNNEDIFLRHIDFKQQDVFHPINIHEATLESCKHDRIKMFKQLLLLRPNINWQDDQNKRALHYAAINRSLEMTKLIIKAGSAVNCCDKMTYCPIHYACENGQADIVEYLITKGAFVNFSKIHATGENPIHVACRAGHADVVEVLLSRGANIHAPLEHNQNCQMTPLHVAAKNSQSEVVDLLCSKGASVNRKDSTGHIPLHFSAQEGDIKSTKILLVFGSDASAKAGEEGLTPLILAVTANHVEIVKLLLQWEPNVNIHNGEHVSTLLASLTSAETECLELLLRAGADVNEQRDSQESILMIAVGLPDIEKVKCLIKYHADVNLADYKLFTPLHRVQAMKEPDSTKIELTKILLQAGAKLNTLDVDGWTPLHRAIFTNVIRSSQSQPCIQLLVEAGSRLWPGSSSNKGNSPLLWLSWNKQLPVADYLVQAGWDMEREFWIYVRPRFPQQYKLHLMFQDMVKSPRPLKYWCRKELRNYLTFIRNDKEILSSIDTLPVPSTVKNYLLFGDCEFKSDEYFDDV